MTLAEWLARGPFGLAMSSGFFGFYAHAGMLQAILARGFRPAHVAGSSAGALVGGAWAAGIDPESLGTTLLAIEREQFSDPAPGLGFLAGKKFDRRLRELLPVAGFEACRVPARISVFDIARRATTVLATGDLVDAIRASCAVPAMFHPVWIAGRAYWDGGILDRPGIAGPPVGERLLFHHLSSRSPWRRLLDVPRRAGMVTLVIEGLARSGPFRLEAGHRAFEQARRATERALDQPIEDSMIRVAA